MKKWRTSGQYEGKWSRTASGPQGGNEKGRHQDGRRGRGENVTTVGRQKGFAHNFTTPCWHRHGTGVHLPPGCSHGIVVIPTSLGMPVPSPLQTAADRLVNLIYVVLDSTFRYAGVYTAVCRVGSRDGTVLYWLGVVDPIRRRVWPAWVKYDTSVCSPTIVLYLVRTTRRLHVKYEVQVHEWI